VRAAAAAGLILRRAAGAAGAAAPADPSQALYRRQLAEIEELAERGLIGEAERRGAEAEAGRRLLAAADAPAEPWGSDNRSRTLVFAAAAAAAGLALALYLVLGAPGAPDQPFARRLAAWRGADLERLSAQEIAAVLRQVTKERPGDAEGLRLLAIAEAASENYPAAARDLRAAVKLAPQRADLWRTLGEALVFQAGGKVGPDAQDAFREALRRDPNEVGARFYLAQAKVEAGDAAGGVAEFRAVLAALPAGDERRQAVEAMIARAEGRPVLRADEGQMAMIRGMVERLDARLKANPDDPEGWVRLVRAYAVLGNTQKRDAAYAAARARYTGAPQVLSQLDEAARAEPMR
jgi:cytochrome c-type biogenesis protein CcmH